MLYEGKYTIGTTIAGRAAMQQAFVDVAAV